MNAKSAILDALDLPHVWRGRELAQAQEKTVATGHASLDAHLPGRGWPLGNLVEILQGQAQQHVWQLVGPALAAVMQEGDPAVLVHPPYQPFGPSLRAQGIEAERLLCVQTDKVASRLWATEQALRCADVCAVLAWLPQARNEDLRRLHLCAQSGEKLLLVFRGLDARQQSSAARLRLQVQGTERMEVLILKRRGPPLLQPLVLRSQPQRLSALLSARKGRRTVAPTEPIPIDDGSHVLDRTASFAG
jgi:protein ImuA